MILGASTATAFYIGLAVGGVAAAGTGVAVWKWQEGKIDKLLLSNLRFEAAARVAEQQANNKADVLQATVSSLGVALQAAQKRREDEFATSTQRIDEVATANQCFTADTVRVLDGDRPRHRPAPPRQSPREILGLAPAPAADPARGGASELTVARWINHARKTHGQLRDQTQYLIEVVEKAKHCFEIVE